MTDKILLENGDSVLLENGDKVLQEWGIRWTATVVSGTSFDDTHLTVGQVRKVGDVVFCFAAGVNTSGPTAPTVTPASGWTVHFNDTAAVYGSYGLRGVLLSRTLTSADLSGSIAVATVSGGTLQFDAYGVSGADASATVVQRTLNNTTGGNIVWPAVTATRANPLVIRIGVPNDANPTKYGRVGPAGHDRAPYPNTSGEPGSAAWMASPTSTAIGSTSAPANFDASQYPLIGYTIALNEASAQAANPVSGSVNATLAPTTLTASATVVAAPTITASVSRSLNPMTATASTAVQAMGQSNGQLGPASVSATATAPQLVRTASVNAALGSITGSASATVTAPSTGSQPWTPDEFGSSVVGWWDAQDAASITINQATGRVAKWTGQNGLPDGVEPTPYVNDAIPYSATGFGGSKPGLGGWGFLNVPTLAANPAVWTIMVAQHTTGGDAQCYIGSSNNGSICLRRQNTTQLYFLSQGQFGFNTASTIMMTDQPSIVGGVVQAGPSGSYSYRIDGQDAGGGTQNLDSGGWQPNNLILGGGYATGERLNGVMGEVVIINRLLTPEEMSQLEGYLAWKWGTEARLPAAHPYKAAAPTTGSAGPGEATANLTQTLAAATSVGSATVSVSGQTNKSLAPATSTAAASVVAQGSLARALGGLSSASAAKVQVTAQTASSLAPAASSANGQVTVSATASPILGAMVSTATGAIAYPGITGSSSVTLGAATTTASAGVQVTASANRSLGAATSVSLGSVLVVGSASAQLAPTTVSATAGPIVSVQASQSLGGLTVASTAGVEVRAQAGVTLGQGTLASTALGAPKAGLVSTLGTMTAAASATVQVTGSAAASLAPTSVAATGSSTVNASVAKSLAPATSTASATAPATASANRSLSQLQTVSNAQVGVRAFVSATLAPATLNASSGSSSGANLTATLAPISVQSTGVVRIGGATISGLSPMTGSATGVVPVAANSNATLSDLTAASNVVTPIFGRATATLEPMSAQSQVFTLVDGQTGAVLGEVSLSAYGTARLFGILEIDPSRLIVIPAESRVILQPAEDRSLTIPAIDRKAS